MTGKDLYVRLLRHVVPYWRMFVVAVVAMVILAATEPALPALLKPTLDGSFVEKDLHAVGIMSVLIIVLFVVRGLATFVTTMALTWVGGKVVMDLRNEMFDKLVSLSSSYYDGQATGTLISKVTFDAAQLTEAASNVLLVVVKDTLSILGLLAWMLYLQWQLTLITFITAPVVVLTVKYFSKRLRATSHLLQDSMGDVTHVLEETIDGQHVVRSFGGQDYEKSRFASAADNVFRSQLKFMAASTAQSPVAQVIIAIALAVILFLAAHLSAAGDISIGGFVSFFAAMAMLFGPIKRLTSINAVLQRGIAAASSVFALIDEPSEPDHGTRTIGRARGLLEFRDVGFTYDTADTPALAGISISVEPGETLALVGHSGSGKSTLANLVPCFYRPDAGAILLDGIDIRELTLASLRANIALVSQEIVLFNDTVAANIAYGPLASASRQAIVDAARAAHAMEFIDNLPRGLDTEVGQKGVRLSGGQRQRLAIARAFLKDAPLLILDEATSSVDNVAEQHIQAGLEALRKGRTTIVIAHRLSTIERADKIAVMDAGRIVDVGRHTDLLERSSLYASLYRFQIDHRAGEAAAAGAS
ncbi:MAG: lipid A export permease/ATP-binding protein MsbA [Gammaproteobacteria bacterium]|nr:lipid A export permease/ATP-binding protein MsbA [Gammaproteobacteria bacterium]NIP89425.1 lipid A export permease/ATP-binding protein MsbA [Gammaproteobacteria bacterium]NIR24259.1 lipid A export permease/ATP-binding protein MsbA [Gammaproteobacteria bacterium]NIS05928.1 lipid A export permease/ATP-binding protein MsbA [Gammaproteobacteria bacterium]NIU41166.1 lipid A export permease/ATP-binding protein MsbA [Gammaproteobacteria bacterium]